MKTIFVFLVFITFSSFADYKIGDKGEPAGCPTVGGVGVVSQGSCIPISNSSQGYTYFRCNSSGNWIGQTNSSGCNKILSPAIQPRFDR